MRANLALAALSTVFSLYLVQAGLMAFYHPGTTAMDLADEAVKRGVPFDTRTPSEVLRDLSRSRSNLALHYGVGFIPLHGIRSEGNAIFPLSGLTEKSIISCNEFGEYPIIPSDEHGFFNPKGLYGGQADIVIIGDSFVQGACVRQGEDIASRLRRKHPKTISLGQAGIGPLIELAILKEYAEPLRPKTVVWLYYSGDVANDLRRERESPFLMQYLNPGFSQGLVMRSREADKALSVFFESHRQSPLAPELPASLSASAGTRFVRFLTLYYLRTVLLQRYPLDISDKRQLELFLKIIEQARTRVDSWGGRLVFGYLPERSFFIDRDRRRADRFRAGVLAGVRARSIPVIDLYEYFSKQSDPLSFFFLGKSTHYNAKGYNFVAETIEKSLKEGRR